MFRKQLDILTIGDITTDAFIRLKDSHIHCKVDHNEKDLCIPFGEKIPFEYVKTIRAVGNAANAAVATKLLGLRSAVMTNIGDDQNGKDCITELQKKGINISHIITHDNKPTNYHFVLWYDVDRTILVNHVDYNYKLPANFVKNKSDVPKWLYLTSLAASASTYHDEIVDYLDANPSVKLAFQPGTYQIKLGSKILRRLYARADLFVVNINEAKTILGIKSSEKKDPKSLLVSLASLGPKLVAITDDTNGSYLYDGDNYYHMPIYPDARPPLERTGCGDAWSATFVAALALGKTPLEALMWAPVNPMSVAQFIGSQEGLLALDQLEWWLSRAPDNYRPREI